MSAGWARVPLIPALLTSTSRPVPASTHRVVRRRDGLVVGHVELDDAHVGVGLRLADLLGDRLAGRDVAGAEPDGPAPLGEPGGGLGAEPLGGAGDQDGGVR